ncbi:DUF1761 domain-containing protein [Bacillus salitolerans]|uniref:DUF1761 domain-containing protein n=1 Tax=Bacillus salitolerans TaxID=1437434 RepID=A0ABW4LRX9_9BACI
MFIDWSQIEFLPVLIGGIVYVMYGAIYYSLLLSDKKGRDKQFIDQQSKGPFKYMVSVMIAFISSFLMAGVIQFVHPENFLGSMGIGFLIGFIICMVYLKNTLFGLMSKKSFLLAIGDHLIIFTLLGAIHGLFL